MAKSMTDKKINWAGFSKKSPKERIEHLEKNNLLDTSSSDKLIKNEQLSLATANQMVENVLANFSLPFALAPDFLIDEKNYHVPFVTEEPSVVAAASFAAKIIKRSGGFTTRIHNRKMIGQVALYQVPDKKRSVQQLLEVKDILLAIANQSHPSIVTRGGGACDLSISIKDEFVIVYLEVDTQEAMGANIVNTMMESLTPTLEELSEGKSLMAILSNYATESLVTSECQVDLRFLDRDPKKARESAEKIVLASKLADLDIYRASTHNKGIFNGIDAVALATGNDWRAIESGVHTYACKDGQYHGLSTWRFDQENNVLKGSLTLPMPIATKGGSIGLNPTVQVAHQLLNHPTAKELASVIVSVGLAQNFAALKALTGRGIQAGHMKLHAKSLALLAGASEDEVNQVLPKLLGSNHLNLKTAKDILRKIREKKN